MSAYWINTRTWEQEAYSTQTQSRAPHRSHPTSLPPLLLLHVLRLLLIPSVLLLRVAPLVRILLRIAALLAIPTTILLRWRMLLLMGLPKELTQKSFRAARLLLLSRWKRLLAVAAWRYIARLTVGRLIATAVVVVRGATVHCACCALVFFRLEGGLLRRRLHHKGLHHRGYSRTGRSFLHQHFVHLRRRRNQEVCQVVQCGRT